MGRCAGMGMGGRGLAAAVIAAAVLAAGCVVTGPAGGSALARPEAAVYVRPLDPGFCRGARLAVLPFAAADRDLGEAAAAVFRDVFLASGLFRSVILVDERVWTREQALAAARGADLALFARVNRAFVDGGDGGSELDLSLRVLQVRGGDTVWYIRQRLGRPVAWPRRGLAARLGRSLGPAPSLAPLSHRVMPAMLQAAASEAARLMGGRPDEGAAGR